MYKCPNCGNNEFGATAHVAQDWIINEHGDWIKTVTDCLEVVHFPDEDDLWDCTKCHYNSSGADFKFS